MKKTIETKIPYLSLVGARISDTQALSERFMYLINNRVVLHNDQLDIDYIVLSAEVEEVIYSLDYKVRINIEILDTIDKEILKQIDTLKESLGELLPTKRPEKFAGEEW